VKISIGQMRPTFEVAGVGGAATGPGGAPSDVFFHLRNRCLPQADIQPQPRRRPGYWTELCFIKLPTIARNTSGLSLATFWNSASSEDSDAPGCFSIKSSISFSAASMVLDLSGVMISRLLQEACIHFMS
jgi:hypothetical protein